MEWNRYQSANWCRFTFESKHQSSPSDNSETLLNQFITAKQAMDGDNSEFDVSAYIDAAYAVHTTSGRSHTGCTITLGRGPVHVKSSKQKTVTKSSTEAELMGLSDMAGQAIHLRNFVIAQGYTLGPAILYQDNMSCS
jgi:hypothetical protein